MTSLARILAVAALALPAAAALAAQLVVIDTRGGGLKPGMTIDSAKPIALKEGERLTAITPDGRTVSLRGVYRGLPIQGSSAASDPRQALAALIATRNARASAIGAVRAGVGAAPLPDPWLVDISRPGARCVREGATPIWWRGDTSAAEPFTVYPVDRSWRADFTWAAGQDRMLAPPLAKLNDAKLFVIRAADHDNTISLNIIPAGITDDLILTAWMLEKGCLPQADAYLQQLQQRIGEPE